MASPQTGSESTPLDRDIQDLRAEVASLRKALKIQCSTILSSSAAVRGMAFSGSPSSDVARQASASTASSRGAHADNNRLGPRPAQQRAYMQQCRYRTCAPVTAFKVRDPDPHAVDGGHVLGLRFEVMSRAQFLPPYYVMLNRPFARAKNHLRLHRHTLPAAVPLAGLAARHLPAPPADGDAPPQDLDRFVRALRRDIARYHNRLGVSADLRRRLGLHEPGQQPESADSIVDVAFADTEAKQIKLTWADDRSGRLVMDDDGRVLKLVVLGAQGRDWETARELFQKYDCVDDVAKKLQERSAVLRSPD